MDQVWWPSETKHEPKKRQKQNANEKNMNKGDSRNKTKMHCKEKNEKITCREKKKVHCKGKTTNKRKRT